VCRLEELNVPDSRLIDIVDLLLELLSRDMNEDKA